MPTFGVSAGLSAEGPKVGVWGLGIRVQVFRCSARGEEIWIKQFLDESVIG